jgi:hypothetical protein
MKPTHAKAFEKVFPVKVSFLQLRYRRMPAVRHSAGPSNPKAALGEIQSVSNRSADAIVRSPSNMRRIHASLKNEILHQPPHGVIGQGGNQPRFHAETPAQSASHIIFTTSFPYTERSGGMDSAFPRVKPQHDLTQGN